jgi:23S rRNA (adenine2503-C2)-methyltransferase
VPRVRLKTLDKAGLSAWAESAGEKPFRARQLWSWMYRKGASSFEAMTDLSKAFRMKLSDTAELDALRLAGVSGSPSTGTRKFLWECADGLRIETVFIPEADRKTVCVSSQVGCALGCGFCATGAMGFARNLESWEIVEQVLGARRETGTQPTNIVVMGMGEPFLNYENVMNALAVINDPEGVAIGHRRITISTAGIPPGIARFTAEKQPYRLAISLNATSDAVRSRIMPVNEKYPLKELMAAAREYSGKTGGRITFEYVLIRNVNDSMRDAERLLKLLKNIPCKVNLIPYNPGREEFERPEDARVSAFLNAIKPLASPVIVRMSRGVDIAAACGQLATPNPAREKRTMRGGRSENPGR